MKLKPSMIPLTTTAILALSTNVNAAPLTSQQILGSFDVVAQSFTTSSETWAPIYVGTLSGTGGPIDTLDNPPPSGFADANIAGNASGTWVMGGNRTVMVGGSGGNFLSPGTGSILSGATFPETLTQVLSTLTSYYDFLRALPTTGTFNPSTGVFSGGNVYDITVGELDSVTSPLSGLIAGDIVNVSGGNFIFDENFTPSLPDGVLWTSDATSVVFNSEFQGSFLDPLATIDINAAFEGDVIGNDVTSVAEIHDYFPSDLPPDSPVNEPSTWLAMLGGILVAIGAKHWWLKSKGEIE